MLLRKAALLCAVQLVLPSVAVAGSLVIPVGTPVTLTFDETVAPATTPAGTIVHLSVMNDVSIDGVVAIPAGAAATAEVISAEKPGSIGKPASISLEARTVEASDGTIVPVVGTKFVEGEDKQSSTLIITILCCVLGLLMKGGDVEIPAGATMDCTVQIATEIEAF